MALSDNVHRLSSVLPHRRSAWTRPISRITAYRSGPRSLLQLKSVCAAVRRQRNVSGPRRARIERAAPRRFYMNLIQTFTGLTSNCGTFTGTACAYGMTVEDFCEQVVPLLGAPIAGCPTETPSEPQPSCATVRCMLGTHCVMQLVGEAGVQPQCIPFRDENETCGLSMTGDLGRCKEGFVCHCRDPQACAADAPHTCINVTQGPLGASCCRDANVTCEYHATKTSLVFSC